jgi:hypothetical protein
VKLIGANGNEFELTVAGYQFPNIEDDRWDSNWLHVAIDVRTDNGSWTSTDPSLLTSDVERLASWLDSVAADRTDVSEISFLEPNLSFGLHSQAGDTLTIRVWFELESRPAWAEKRFVGDRDFFIDIESTSGDIARASKDLRQQRQEFPPRAGVN